VRVVGNLRKAVSENGIPVHFMLKLSVISKPHLDESNFPRFLHPTLSEHPVDIRGSSHSIPPHRHPNAAHPAPPPREIYRLLLLPLPPLLIPPITHPRQLTTQQRSILIVFPIHYRLAYPAPPNAWDCGRREFPVPAPRGPTGILDEGAGRDGGEGCGEGWGCEEVVVGGGAGRSASPGVSSSARSECFCRASGHADEVQLLPSHRHDASSTGSRRPNESSSAQSTGSSYHFPSLLPFGSSHRSSAPSESPDGRRLIDCSSDSLPVDASLRERLDVWRDAPGGRGEIPGEVELGGFNAWNLEVSHPLQELEIEQS